MTTIDVAIDDYLHAIVRTRPWTKPREEELLENFSAWLYQQPEARVTLDEIQPDLAQQYAAAACLTGPVQTELLGALRNLYTWSVYAEVVNHNPFAGT